jgi:hypothetical protein
MTTTKATRIMIVLFFVLSVAAAVVVVPKLTIDEFRALTSFKDKIESILKNDQRLCLFSACALLLISLRLRDC